MAFQSNEHRAVSYFRKYLRIKSVHPNVNYDECVAFISALGDELGLPTRIVNVHPGKPVVIITFTGLNPELPSILLNSHMDVVPVFREAWSYDPFAAEKDENGNIYARGAQDMKCIGIQYIETVRKYIEEGLRFRRTIHLSFVPDEEIGGILGMSKFVLTDEFKSLNVGFSLDEGMPNPTDEFMVYYAERAIWHLDVVCPGTTGHGSLLHDNTAGEKLRYVINKFMNWRDKEKERLQSNPELALGDVTTVNLTMLNGGVQANVLPTQLSATFDVRLAIHEDHQNVENTIRRWCQEAGDHVDYKFIVKNPKGGITQLDENNPWWMVFEKECDIMKLKLKTVVFPGGTDSRFIRQLGISAIGFSPINNTPNLLHNDDEYLNEETFLRGLDIYYNIIKSLASM